MYKYTGYSIGKKLYFLPKTTLDIEIVKRRNYNKGHSKFLGTNFSRLFILTDSVKIR